jgi:FMN-binding protein
LLSDVIYTSTQQCWRVVLRCILSGFVMSISPVYSDSAALSDAPNSPMSAPDATAIVKAEGEDSVYLSVEQLIGGAFEQAPSPSMLWLDQDARDQAKSIAGEDPGFRRRYWREGDTTVWVLDVIGRDHPITVGVVVNDTGIKAVNVLVYRESRGWEVRHDFFTKQFNGVQLKGKKLDRRIDGITGATLSVRALQRAARLALWLHQRAIAS